MSFNACGSTTGVYTCIKYMYVGNMTRQFKVPDYMRDMSCVLPVVYVLVVSIVVYVDAVHVTLYVYSIPAYMSCVLVYVVV